jgi:dethiobiotin synthetase
VSVELARALRRRGLAVAARKPAQSFAEGDPGPTDADLLAAATGEPVSTVCPPQRSYPIAMAPPMAAAALGRPAPTIAELTDRLWEEAAGTGAGGEPARPIDIGLVEPAGGLRSPLAADGDSLTLADAVGSDLLVLVADAGLGAINVIRLCVDAMDTRPFVVHLNRFDDDDAVHRANLEWLRGADGLPVTVTIEALGDEVLAAASPLGSP